METPPTTIVLATANPHKIEELRSIFTKCGLHSVSFVGLADVGVATREPAETGSTFDENATIKALSYAAQTGRPCLADDSGLEIDALGGRPGVISSHYCTDGREAGMGRAERDARNNERALREMTGVSADQRGARFVCVMVLASPGAGIIARTRGTIEGRIGEPPAVPRGMNGFGYDPLFLVGPGHERTGAELTAAEKNAISHRGVAARGMVEAMRDALGLTPTAP